MKLSIVESILRLYALYNPLQSFVFVSGTIY